MGGNRADLGIRAGVPDDDGAIFAGGGELRAIGGKVERTDPTLVLLEIGLEGPAGEVPELDEAVVAGRGGELAVVGGLDRPHGRRVAGEITGPVAVGRIPDRGVTGAVEETLAAGGEELGAVGGVVGGDHPARVGREVGSGSRGSGRGGILGRGPAGADCHQDDDRDRTDEAVRT